MNHFHLDNGLARVVYFKVIFQWETIYPFAVIYLGCWIKRFDYLATKPMIQRNFLGLTSEIYAALSDDSCWVSFIPRDQFRDVAYAVSSSEGKIGIRGRLFQDSLIIKRAIANYSGPKRVTWHPNNYHLGDQRLGLPYFNGGTLRIEDNQVIVEVPCACTTATIEITLKNALGTMAWDFCARLFGFCCLRITLTLQFEMDLSN